ARVISSSNVPSQRPESKLGPAAARRSSRVVTNPDDQTAAAPSPVPAPKINGPGGRQGCITSTRGRGSIRLPSHTQEHTCDEARSGGSSSTSDGLSCCCRKTSHPGSGRCRSSLQRIPTSPAWESRGQSASRKDCPLKACCGSR